MKIGVDIGGSHIAIGAVNQEGKISIKKSKNINKEDRKNLEKFIVENIAISINNILKELKLEQKDIETIGIACPGTILTE